jgi:hypothetical protein
MVFVVMLPDKAKIITVMEICTVVELEEFCPDPDPNPTFQIVLYKLFKPRNFCSKIAYVYIMYCSLM